MADHNQQQAHRNHSLTRTSLLRIAQENQRRYRMKKPSLADLKHKASVNTLESGDKDRKTHRDIRPEDKEAYDSQDEFLLGSPRNIHGSKWILLMFSLMSLPFLVGLDGTITADIQATFVSGFQSMDTLAFNSAAFFLGAGASVLTWSQIYGLFNSKWVLVASIVTYEVGSTICGAARNSDSLIVGRAISGIGGSGMTIGVWAIIALTTTEQERSTYLSLPFIAWGIGTVLGPIIGGAFVQGRATWRWGYYIQLCIGAFFAPALLWLLPSSNPQPSANLKSRVTSIDALGSLLLIGSFLSLILAINFGGLVYSWHSGSVIVLWIISALCFAGFCCQQFFGWLTHQVLFPTAVLKNVHVLVIFLLQACSATAFFVPCYFIPLYFQYVRDETPLSAGIHLLPLVILFSTFAILSGYILRLTGHWLPNCFIGGALAIAGGALMYTVDAYTSVANVYGYSILIGAGAGAYIMIPLNACQDFVSPILVQPAATFITLAHYGAPAITLSIAYAVFLNGILVDVTALLPEGERFKALSMVSGDTRLYLQGLDVRTRHEFIRTVANDLAKGYVLVITSGVLTIIVSTVVVLWKFAGRRGA